MSNFWPTRDSGGGPGAARRRYGRRGSALGWDRTEGWRPLGRFRPRARSARDCEGYRPGTVLGAGRAGPAIRGPSWGFEWPGEVGSEGGAAGPLDVVLWRAGMAPGLALVEAAGSPEPRGCARLSRAISGGDLPLYSSRRLL